MTRTPLDEYHALAASSSDEMLASDSRRALGRYPEAAWHMLQAGHQRRRMGAIMHAAGDMTQAAADWLSAAGCFHLATDVSRMSEVLDRVRELKQQGHLPAERHDLTADLEQREGQRSALDAKQAAYFQNYKRLVGPGLATSPEVLGWLACQVRDLPGLPHPHAAISGQARALGQLDAAAEAVTWARRFDPDSPHLATLHVQSLLDCGEVAQATEVARGLLAAHPEMGQVRFLLAQAVAFRAGPRPTDWHPRDGQMALELLGPLLAPDSADTLGKLLALALAVFLAHNTGKSPEAARFLNEFTALAQRLNGPLATKLVTQLRASLPEVFPLPGHERTVPTAPVSGSSIQELLGHFAPSGLVPA